MSKHRFVSPRKRTTNIVELAKVIGLCQSIFAELATAKTSNNPREKLNGIKCERQSITPQ